MNKRIKELAEQAGYYQEQDYDGTWFLAMAEGCWEKFAELIVNECIDYCGENLSKTIGGALKIHFGVEVK